MEEVIISRRDKEVGKAKGSQDAVAFPNGSIVLRRHCPVPWPSAFHQNPTFTFKKNLRLLIIRCFLCKFTGHLFLKFLSQ